MGKRVSGWEGMASRDQAEGLEQENRTATLVSGTRKEGKTKMEVRASGWEEHEEGEWRQV